MYRMELTMDNNRLLQHADSKHSKTVKECFPGKENKRSNIDN